MTTLPTPDAPLNAACESAHGYPQVIHSKPCSWPQCELTCKGRDHRVSAWTAISSLRPQAPDDKPGEEVEALVKEVRQVLIHRRSDGSEPCWYDVYLAQLCDITTVHRQAPAPENSPRGQVTDKTEAWDMRDRNSQVDAAHHADMVQCGTGGTGVGQDEHQPSGSLPPVSPETPPSDACRERAKAWLAEWLIADQARDGERLERAASLATLLQSMVRATPTPEQLRDLITPILWRQEHGTDYFEQLKVQNGSAQFIKHILRAEEVATAILAQLNGGAQP